MSREQAPVLIACMPVEAAARHMPEFTGTDAGLVYEKTPCPGCAEQMWLGPRGKALVLGGAARALCMVCIIEQEGPEALRNMPLLSGVRND